MASSNGLKGAATEDPDALRPIAGLDAVGIYTALVESVVTRHPREAIFKRIKQFGRSEMPRMYTDEFQTELDFLKRRHDQPDFDAILAKSRETVTQVEYFMVEDDMISLQPAQTRRLNNLC